MKEHDFPSCCGLYNAESRLVKVLKIYTSRETAFVRAALRGNMGHQMQATPPCKQFVAQCDGYVFTACDFHLKQLE